MAASAAPWNTAAPFVNSATGSPMKPWERAGGPTASPSPLPAVSPSQSPMLSSTGPASTVSPLASSPLSALSSTSSALSPGSFGSSFSSLGRPSAYGSRYGSSFGSSYGSSFGGFGSSYGGYRGSYGSYGSYRPSTFSSPYSSFGGVGAYGGTADMQMGAPPPNSWAPLERTLGWMHYVMDSLSRISYLLSANFEAMNGSFSSFLGFYEVLEPVLTIIQGFTLYKLFKGLALQLISGVKWALFDQKGQQASLPATTNGWDEEVTTATNPTNTHTPIASALHPFVTLSLFAGVPLAIWALSKLLRQKAHSLRAAAAAAIAPASTETPTSALPFVEGQKVVALYDLTARNSSQLCLRKGQQFTVVIPTPHPAHPNWVLCRAEGALSEGVGTPAQGLVPADYISPVLS